ncbi:MAG: MMPL family transporter [Salinisphaeraceae bacterium]|nr:MMPL family transporter [Salinisphaeraceae bacterium]
MQITERLGALSTSRPRLITWSVIVVTLLVAIGAYRLTLQTDYRYYFDSDNPDRQAFAELDISFGGTDDILLGLMPDSGKVLTPGNMLRLAAIQDALLDTPFAQRVTSVADVAVALPGATPEEGPQITTLRALAESGVPDPEVWQRAVAEVTRLTQGTLLAKDASIAAAHVRIELPENNDFWDTRAVLQHARALQTDFEANNPDAKLLLAGVLPYYHEILELAMRDIYALFPFAIGIAALMLRMLLGSWRASGACAVPVLCAVVTTVGINGWIGFPVTVAILVVPIIVLVIALAYAVHFTDTHLQLRAEHESARDSALQSLRENIEPVLLTGGTTILGFLAMNSSIAPPYRYMGNITAIGIGVAVVYVVLVMPAMLAMVDPPYWRKKGLLRRGLEAIGERFSKPIHNPLFLIGTPLVILALLACIPLNTVDDNISEWFSGDTRLRQDNLLVDERLTGMQQLYYQLPAPGPHVVHDPAYLKKVEAFAEWLKTQEGVVAVRMLPTLVRSLNESFGDGSRAIPQDPGVTEQLLWTYEFSAAPGDRATGLLNEDRSASLVHVSLRNRPGHEFQAFDRKAQAWLAENAGHLEAPGGNSGVMMFSRMALQNIPPMITGTLAVLLFAAVLVAVVLKSVRLGLISIVPNLLPVGLAFGTWGLVSGHIGIALSVISTAALGIIVDDCIHLLERYKEGRKGGTASPAAACRHAIRRVGGAITITTMVLCVGMGLIGFSQVQPTHELGLWLAIAIAYAWFCDLFLLPQLLTRFDK